MNIAISAFVGLVLATGAVIGGVHVAQGDQKPVDASKLHQYSTK